MTARPQNVGILAMDVYFPASYVRQEELEEYDGVSKGKCTIGLGQDRLAFCTDLEDVISMSLTVVKSLLEKYAIALERIGRLEVGSKTMIDKSKAIKTCLMQLFEESRNGDIEGVDSINAYYGGTAALQNSHNWVESSAWDGRYALVVAADSAIVQQSYARHVYNDFIRNANFVGEDAAAKLEPLATLTPTDSLVNRDLEKVSQQVAKKQYDDKVGPTTMLPKELGNMYCASLYAGLATLVHKKASSLDGKRILLFSYGSGLASSLFSCKFVECQKLSEKADRMEISSKLESRIAVTPKEFVETMQLMKTRYGAKDFIPVSSKSTLRPGTLLIT